MLTFNVDLKNNIVIIAIAATLQILDPKFIVTQQSEAVYFIGIGSEQEVTVW
jgi:hypothetical protein